MKQKSKSPFLKTIAKITVLTLTATLATGCVEYTIYPNELITKHLPPEKAEKLKQEDTENLFKLCELFEQNKDYETLNEEELKVVNYNRRFIKYDPKPKTIMIKSLQDLNDKSRIYFISGPSSLIKPSSSIRPLDSIKCLKNKYNITYARFKNLTDVTKKFNNDLNLEKEILKHNLTVCYLGESQSDSNSNITDSIIKISCPFIHIEKEFISKDEDVKKFRTPEDLKAYYELNREIYNWLKRELQIRNLLKEENN